MQDLEDKINNIRIADSTIGNISIMKDIMLQLLSEIKDNKQEIAKLKTSLQKISLGISTGWL